MPGMRPAELLDRYPGIPLPVLLKNEILLLGVQFTPELAAAAEWAIPNYAPHKFGSAAESPTGKRIVDIPYLATMGDDILVRLRTNDASPYRIVADAEAPGGYQLVCGDDALSPIAFQPRPEWQKGKTHDGWPMSGVGMSQHGDMVIVNPAPGCEYFMYRDEERSESLRCKFCKYGVPDKRTERLGQQIGKGEILDESLARVQETCRRAAPECAHFYMVSGSMADIDLEGERYIQLAEAIARVNTTGVPVTCGSAALKREHMLRLKDAGVTGVCYNLEVWDAGLFERVCPGKSKFVGRDRWLRSLEEGVEIFGPGNVMSAFVAGIELTTERRLPSMAAAVESCLEGTRRLLERGVMSLYSILWPPPVDLGLEVEVDAYRSYFLEMNMGQAALRREHGLTFPNPLVCHHCTYMQLECDLDHYAAAGVGL